MNDEHRLIVQQIPHLRRYARALLSDKMLADDLVQDCLTRAMDRLHLWRPGSNMRTWLFSIMHNIHVNAAKRRANRPDAGRLEHFHENINAQPPAQEEPILMRDLNSALDQLSDDQRQVLLLVALEGLNYAEAAEVLEVPLGTVMSRLNRARRALKETMDITPGSRDAPKLRSVK